MPRFESYRVEYVFSAPATWEDAALIKTMELLIKDAGLGKATEEKASAYLSEAETAAVYATQRLEKDEVFLVCDAGGGTQDLNVLKVVSTAQARLELAPLCWNEGNAIGSTIINYKAKKILL
ncbi:hypothetical protein DOTSEDRAFT_42261 [Dothistroma septosporum NZE10]|uniref:Uncharacterized protein n=1 Tax=Dothistroma septosporum (strain NZE10 / CBS 128990) TaxID=675120 RepID=N1PZZ0_DOTSN|nr:hypothetical protein DOTSEDRAFT_42261 [Dothistroma septosporum NZE10]